MSRSNAHTTSPRRPATPRPDQVLAQLHHDALIPEDALKRAYALRHDPEPAAKMLWACLSNAQLLGFRFSRKYDFGCCTADFYCDRANLIIELGEHPPHLDPSKRVCDIWARNHGLRVMRLHRAEVQQNIEQVLRVLAMILRATPQDAAHAPSSH